MSASNGNLVDKLKPAVMVLRIIVVALASGVMLFVAVAMWMRLSRPQPAAADAEMLTMLAIGLAPLALIASRIVPAILVRNARRQIAAGHDPSPSKEGPRAPLSELGDAGALAGVYQTKTIISAALLEGAAFFSATAYMLEGNQIALGLSLGFAGVILTMFPSASRVAEWIAGQRRLMGEEKLLGRGDG